MTSSSAVILPRLYPFLPGVCHDDVMVCRGSAAILPLFLRSSRRRAGGDLRAERAAPTGQNAAARPRAYARPSALPQRPGRKAAGSLDRRKSGLGEGIGERRLLPRRACGNRGRAP